MKKFVTICSVFAAMTGHAQTFSMKYQVSTTAADTVINSIWVDVDNDSLLDVAISHIRNKALRLEVYQNRLDASWPKKVSFDTGFGHQSNIQFADFNRDNRIDIVISGKLRAGLASTQVFLNKGGFAFEKLATPLFDKAFGSFLFADLNNDGNQELIAADAKKLFIFQQSADGFVNRRDTALSVLSIQSFDSDVNGFKDIAFSGLNANNQPVTLLWLFKDSLTVMKTIKVAEVAGTLAPGDLNHDGFFDLVISGNNSSHELTTQVFQNNKTSFAQARKTLGLDSAALQVADFTSDGLTDISFLGKTALGDTANWIRTSFGDSLVLRSRKVKAQTFGDFDRDGDLDWAQITRDSLKIFENDLGPINKGPAPIANAIAVRIYNRVFFFWERPSDDHSLSKSLTYDLKVFNTGSTLIASEYDSDSRHRLLASHGNIGTANFSIQKLAGNYNFEIQTIDNSFTPETKVICSGAIDGDGPCGTTIDQQNIIACSQTPAVLTPPAPQAVWFSFSKGFVGIHDTFKFEDLKSDTVFSFNPTGAAICSSLRLFNIKTNSTDTVRKTHTRYACQDSKIALEVADAWKNVMWKNVNSTATSGSSVVHTFIKETTATAFAVNDTGCNLKEQFNLKLSKPNLQLSFLQIQIIRGNSAQLEARGGSSFSWTPSSSLNDSQIANPLASPVETTEYTVVVKDSLDCSAEGKVLVEVTEHAFIPTLFTPNGDTRNDNLRIFGLTQASDFKFSIFNREGNLLFETSNLSEATTVGWSGAVNGHLQPPGTYYWKVEGKMANGDLLLNGKKNGVFLLLR
jgi:gliding motility-associated-like protein